MARGARAPALRDEGTHGCTGALLGDALEVARRRRGLGHLRGRSWTTSPAAADDALVPCCAVETSAASRFTTWAYKFALLEAEALRRRAWQGRRSRSCRAMALWREAASTGELRAARAPPGCRRPCGGAHAASAPCSSRRPRRRPNRHARRAPRHDVGLYKTIHDARARGAVRAASMSDVLIGRPRPGGAGDRLRGVLRRARPLRRAQLRGSMPRPPSQACRPTSAARPAPGTRASATSPASGLRSPERHAGSGRGRLQDYDATRAAAPSSESRISRISCAVPTKIGVSRSV